MSTADVYRNGNSPPAAPDVAGLVLTLRGAFYEGLEAGESLGDLPHKFTHTAEVAEGAGVRGMNHTATPALTNCDTLYVPDKNGTGFLLLWVDPAKAGRRRLYLQRLTPSWPTNEV